MSFSGLSALRWLALAPGCALAVVACTSSASRVEVRTDGRLRVAPSEFTDEVGCNFATGDTAGIGYYAATLIDLGLDADAETEGRTDAQKTPRLAGSSSAARCTSTTTFSTASSTAADKGPIKVGHVYAAIVDGYAGRENPDVSGERNGENWSAPAWQWLCGIGGLDETQLDWLVARARDLATAAYVPPADTSAPDTPTELAMDASALMTQPTTAAGDEGSPSGADVTRSSTLLGDTTGADAASTSDAGDAGLDAAAATPTSTATLQSNAPAVDAGSTVSASGSASPVSAAGGFDAGHDGAVLTAAPDAGGRDWRSELSSAARGDFAPPPTVIAGGQSGVRGCVPLF